MPAGISVTNEQREIISALYFDAKMSGSTIAEKMGVSTQVVYTQGKLEKMVREGRIEDAVHYTMNNQMGKSALEWALKKYGKTLPVLKEEPKVVPSIEQKNEVKQIDKDQIARIMYALGNIDDRISSLEQRLDFERKERNANFDSLYKLITDFRNSVIMEMRKRK